MPYHFQDPEPDDHVVLRFDGIVTLEELIASIRELKARLLASGQTRQLLDFRTMQDMRADFRQILFMASKGSGQATVHPRHAMLVDNDFQYGMARMLEQVHDSVSGAPALVTRSKKEAYEWLGLSLPAHCA